VISATNLTKKFNGRTVVDNINLNIKTGEIVGLLGPNGAGKTTTLRMIAGVLPPTDGTVEPADKNLIGFLPENNPLYDDMTVEEFLRFWLKIKNQDDSHLSFVVSHCGIKEVFYQPISELSKGYRQRVGLSQALLAQPEILLLDEPTEGLDPNQRAGIADLIVLLAKKRTVMISSHVLSELAKIATRLVIINQGKIVADDTPTNLRRGRMSQIETEIKGTGVKSALLKLKHVEGVKEKNDIYQIMTGTDIRKDVFNLAVKQNWTMLSLTQKEQELDEVFRQLTT
jgi:ABC-2 type transport system ATP-binding protein